MSKRSRKMKRAFSRVRADYAATGWTWSMRHWAREVAGSARGPGPLALAETATAWLAAKARRPQKNPSLKGGRA